ncbi:MAG: hypothetical protein ACREME_04090, partial [Gemmatimonadales bacterium]
MSDARRLLVVTYHFGPDGPVGGLRWWGITKYLARLGWKISVVTAAPFNGTEAAIDARVERCPRLWTCLDGMRLVRRRVFGPAINGGPNGSAGAERASETKSLIRQFGREVTACLGFP